MAEKEKKALRRFRLNKDSAPHYEPNPEFDPELPEDEDNVRDVETRPGEIVKSRRPLNLIFANKFTPLDAPDSGQASGGDATNPDKDPNRDRPVTSVEDATVKRADRFLDEDELEGKTELKKLAKGKKVQEDEDEEEESFLEEEDDVEDEEEVEEAPPKKKKKKSKSK